ncbi:DUF6056 family protein [Clostridium pasteurianum]|uniref:Glycosyltransferase RgtA/B/C/D-like domain-containing protein n=1 Tax=Clostridium pasteurianum BC1 TaxID=86416 RepID=R4K837_CLOPA|nr:DUF6056 family protein [Clostridium pasteurianum]AGK97861.1 hypothetical protein Clopa_3033 [Clostridium pasteurianum BC1]
MKYHIDKKNALGKNIILNVITSKKLPFFILFIIMLYVHILHNMQLGDDFWFQQATRSYSLVDYLQLRYMNWTGRISAELILYFIFRDGGVVWKFINPLFITLMAYSISRIIVGKKNDKNNYILNWYICIGWLLISKSIILDSIMWITGSIVYLWPMLAALVAAIPFVDALKKSYNKNFSILYIFCAAFASMGEEQIALVLVVFITIINAHIYIRDKKIYKYLIIENIITIVGSVVLFIAPGNLIRNQEETINWLPNYPLYSKWQIIFNGVQWLLNTLLNDSKIILFLVLLVLSILLYKKNRGLKNNLSILIPIIGCILIFSAIIFSLDIVLPSKIVQEIRFPHAYNYIWNHLNTVFFNFNMPDPFAIKKISIIKFIIWPVIIATVPYFIWQLYDFESRGLYVALVYIAGICSVIIMFISATIYASGSRTFFVLAIMFFMVFISLLKKSEFLLKKRYLFILAIFAVAKYIYIFIYTG